MKTKAEVILSNHCLWLGGEIGKHDSCCEPKSPGQSYCVRHLKIVYKPHEPRQRKEQEIEFKKTKIPNF